MNRYLIACGGTGGHLAPGIALAEELSARGHPCTLLVSQKRVDARLIEKYPQFNFVRAPGAPFVLNPIGLLKCLYQQTKSIGFNLRLMKQLKPDRVIGFGGFTNAGVILAAYLNRIPCALHESNRIPGRAIRFLGPLTDRVYLPPGVHLPRAPLSKIRQVGMPVRREFRRIGRSNARIRLGFDPAQKMLLVLGGSQGAQVLNDWVRRRLEFLAQEGIQVCCLTGIGKGAEGIFEHRSRSGLIVRSRFMQFSDKMAELLSAADLVVSRAGAGTIAELIRCAVPAILIPYPHAADNHQQANAAFFEKQGGGIALSESQMGNLHKEVMDCMFNDWLLTKFRVNLRRMDREDTLRQLIRDLEILGEPVARRAVSHRYHAHTQVA
jgi:UDP-N-acetylglucosamine--N-acetylmuramyl-(pentapeptide) pyrophosphoryl-undecaprenol N-acetylglucosamine transferase